MGGAGSRLTISAWNTASWNGEVPGTALVAQSWDSLITDRGNNPKGKGGLEIRVIFVRNT